MISVGIGVDIVKIVTESMSVISNLKSLVLPIYSYYN